jgi:glutaredoxin-related protein
MLDLLLKNLKNFYKLRPQRKITECFRLTPKGYVLLKHSNRYLEKEIKNWQAYLHEKDDEQPVKDIRKSSMTGHPCGDEEFIQRIEELLSRKLRALS